MAEHQIPGPPAPGDAAAATTGERNSVSRSLRAVAAPDAGARAAERALEVGRLLQQNVETVVHGKHREIQLVLAALAAQGHVLFEDVPGTAKTVLARAVAGSIAGATPSRIQCTPDLQPADVTGSAVYDQRTRTFEFRAGPIFANIVLLDEVNRATQKTQSALLEAMAERQVTVDGETRPLPRPFLLLATENPVEYEGTFLLPEAQLDRFLLRTELGYPGEDDEERIVLDQRGGHPLDSLGPVATVEDVLELQTAVERVYVDPLLRRWIVDVVRATRELPFVELGASVRGSLALDRTVRAWALLSGRDYAVPEDVEELFGPVIGHRILFTPAFLAEVRQAGRGEGLRRLWDASLAAAPRPAPPP